MKKKLFVKRLGSIILATMMMAPVGPLQAITQSPVLAATTETGLATEIEDGVALVAYDWSFNAIRNKLPEIAAAGYTSVQVSPIQGTKEGTKNANNWWVLYQPTNQAIGNAQLGTRDEFAALCTEAENYGIKIIVDAVLNHMANNGDNNSWKGVVDPAFDRSDFYHNLGQCSQWDNRWAVTQQGIGMPDLNTQHPEVQSKAIAFLNDCIACGADGFRFDAAKHIETDKGLDAGQSWASNYWSNVTGNINNKDDIFLYGEILQGGADNMSAYTNYMKVTDHSYGATLRNAVANKNLYGIGSYASGLSADSLVSYFENHDTYQDGNSKWLSDYQRKMCWGILAARADVTPLLLSRPTSSIGNSGEELWKNEEIVAINYFHNAMAGQNEYIRYPKAEAVVIDRGTIGTAIINTSDGFYLDSQTNLADGTYKDKAGSGATFNVSNGRITGNVPGGRIVVLYEGSGPIDTTVTTVTPGTPVAGEEVTITYNAANRNLSGSSNMYIHWGYDGWLTSEDVKMTSTGTNTWTATFTVPEEANTLDYVFTNGSAWDNNNGSDWSVSVTGGIDNPVKQIKAYFVKPSNWGNNINIYVYDDSTGTTKTVAAWPGVAMTNEGNDVYSYTLPSDWTSAKVVFNDGNNQAPGMNQGGYTLSETMMYANGSWYAYED